jgi:hypothetical protein
MLVTVKFVVMIYFCKALVDQFNYGILTYERNILMEYRNHFF